MNKINKIISIWPWAQTHILAAAVVVAVIGSIATTAVPVSADDSDQVDGHDQLTGEDLGSIDSQAYTRFETGLTALQSFSGTLKITGEGFADDASFAVGAGDSINVSVQLPEIIGDYSMELQIPGEADALLSISGNLQKIAPGEYEHRFIRGSADPTYFNLSNPEENGAMVHVGYVTGHFSTCVGLQTALTVDLVLGLDVDGDGSIDPTETEIANFIEAIDGCLETSESDLPLTSRYSSKVVLPSGEILAINEGVYDFLKKQSTITGEKRTDSNLISAFALTWERTPLAASFGIQNGLLHQEGIRQLVEPGEKESTEDKITNESGIGSVPEITLGLEEGNVEVSANGGSDESPRSWLDILVDNWIFMGLGAAALYALYMVLSTHRHPSRRD